MTVAVTGASGRMGRTILELASDRGVETIAVSQTFTDVDEAVSTCKPETLPSVLAERSVDALIDFTVPAASVEFLDACVETETPAVIGTTGFEASELDRIERASDVVPVLRAANFARGVQGLLALVREAAGALPGYDVELTETHHNGKRDAPSGTANTLLDAIEEETDATERVYGRDGIQPRNDGEIGVHVRRAGSIRGEHEVVFAGNDEVLTLTHRAESRRVFAAGALDAAAWLHGREPRRYTFSEVIADT